MGSFFHGLFPSGWRLLSPFLLCLLLHLHGGKSPLKDLIEAQRSSLHRSPTSKLPSSEKERKPQEANINLPYFHGKDNVEVNLVWEIRVEQQLKKKSTSKSYGSHSYPKKDQGQGILGVTPSKPKDDKGKTIQKQAPKASMQEKTSSIKCFKCLGRRHITFQCPTIKTMIMRGQDIYSSQDKATTSPSSSESEKAKGEESSEEIYPQEEGQPLVVKEKCKEVSVSSKRLAKKETHFTIKTNIKEKFPLRQPPHFLFCKKTPSSIATPRGLEFIPQVKKLLDEGLVRKSLNPCVLLVPKIDYCCMRFMLPEDLGNMNPRHKFICMTSLKLKDPASIEAPQASFHQVDERKKIREEERRKIMKEMKREKHASYSSHNSCKSISEELCDYYEGRHRSHLRPHSHRREKERKPQEANINLPYFHGKDNVEANLVWEIRVEQQLKKKSTSKSYGSHSYPKKDQGQGILGGTPSKPKDDKGKTIEKQVPKASMQEKTSSNKFFKCLGKGHITSQCPTTKTMIMRSQDIYSSQDEATTESEEAIGEESSEEIYPQEEGQPLMVKEECKEVSVSSKRLVKKESHFEIKTYIKETSPLRQPPHLLLCKKTLVSTATPLGLEVIPQVKELLDEGLLKDPASIEAPQASFHHQPSEV
ncbi:hypothetical protein HKD37_02G004695 [Glycine soja]